MDRYDRQRIMEAMFQQIPHLFPDMGFVDNKGHWESRCKLFGGDMRARREKVKVSRYKDNYSVLEQGGETMGLLAYYMADRGFPAVKHLSQDEAKKLKDEALKQAAGELGIVLTTNTPRYQPVYKPVIRRLSEAPKEFCIPWQRYKHIYGNRSDNLYSYLQNRINEIYLIPVWDLYLIGSMGDRIVFPYISSAGKIIDGKVFRYENGHRKAISWLSSDWKMKQDGQSIDRPLFGSHLLQIDPAASVNLVESEKSAIIGTIEKPTAVWIATGGIGNLNPSRLSALRGRKISVYPDCDGVEQWEKKTIDSQRHGLRYKACETKSGFIPAGNKSRCG